MSHFSSSSVASLKELAIIIFSAVIGGLVVVIGLAKEYKWEKEEYSDIGDFRLSKRKRKGAEIWVIVGVALEVIIGAWLAWHEWDDARRTEREIAANDPRNLPLASVVAYVAIAYNTNTAETNFWDGVLSLTKTADSPWLQLSTSNGDFLFLDAAQRHGNDPGNGRGSAYIRRFDWDAVMREMQIVSEEEMGQWHKKTNELKGDVANSIVSFEIENIPFPHKTEIVGGKIELFFNGTVLKKFLMPPQRIAGPPWAIFSDPNPFWQRQLGATNWSFIDRGGMLQTTSLPPASLKSIAISNETWFNVGIPQ